jgi:hypothetical protein
MNYPPRLFQAGGPMMGGPEASMADPAMDPAMAGGMPPEMPQEGGQDPGAELQGMVAEYAQTRDPQAAVAIADALVGVMGMDQGMDQGMPPQDPGMGGAPPMMGRNGMSIPLYKKGGSVPYATPARKKTAVQKFQEFKKKK